MRGRSINNKWNFENVRYVVDFVNMEHARRIELNLQPNVLLNIDTKYFMDVFDFSWMKNIVVLFYNVSNLDSHFQNFLRLRRGIDFELCSFTVSTLCFNE